MLPCRHPPWPFSATEKVTDSLIGTVVSALTAATPVKQSSAKTQIAKQLRPTDGVIFTWLMVVLLKSFALAHLFSNDPNVTSG
jgi:hypothetical protein